jgi:hypothetical protein
MGAEERSVVRGIVSASRSATIGRRESHGGRIPSRVIEEERKIIRRRNRRGCLTGLETRITIVVKLPAVHRDASSPPTSHDPRGRKR